jgi:hypothetical protein
MLDTLHVFRRQQQGLTVRDSDDLVHMYRQVTHLALAAGFLPPPPLSKAGLTNFNPMDLSAKPFPNRDAGKEWEHELRSLQTAAREAQGEQADEGQRRGSAAEAASPASDPASTQPATTQTPLATPQKAVYRFERNGNIWHIQFGSNSKTVRDRKGYWHIAELLAKPNTPISAANLLQEDAEDPVFADLPDEEAVAQYRKEAEKLLEQLEEAKNAGDSEKYKEIETKLQYISKQIAQGGSKRVRNRRPRTRQMDRVRHNIKNAVDELKEKNNGIPALAAHLEQSLDPLSETYTYKPPAPAPDWQIRL